MALFQQLSRYVKYIVKSKFMSSVDYYIHKINTSPDLMYNLLIHQRRMLRNK